MSLKQPPEPNLVWQAVSDGKRVELSGEVIDSSVQAELVAAAKRLFPDREIVDNLRVNPGRSTKWPKVVAAGLEQLARLRSGVVRLDGEVLAVDGVAPDTAVATQVKTAVTRNLPSGYRGQANLQIKSDAMIWSEQEARRKSAAAAAAKKAEEDKARAEEARRALALAEVQRRAAEEAARARAEAEARRRVEEDAARRRAEAEARLREDQERIASEEASFLKLLEDERRREAEEAAQREAEARRRAAEEEARRQAEAEARRRAEEEARRQAEAEARRRAAEEEARRQAEAEARRRAAEEEARRQAEAEARRRAAEEEARRQAEAEARRRAAEEEARRQAEAEARRRAAEEAAQRQAEAETRRLAEVCRRELNEAVNRGEIRFESGSDELRGESTATLDALIGIYRKCPGARIEIGGHTDSTGKADDNLDLSLRRAEAVLDYFVAKGLPRENFIARGYGETRPLASNRSPGERARNRRIEFGIAEP